MIEILSIWARVSIYLTLLFILVASWEMLR